MSFEIILPSGVNAICPDVYNNPFTLTACEYGPIADGAFFVFKNSIFNPIYKII
jgi:hypothetical protein